MGVMKLQVGKMKQKRLNGAGDQPEPTLGGILRAAREAKGLSIADLERETRIRHVILEALEENDFQALPEPVFVRGFLRNLAGVLDLDKENLLTFYNKVQRQRGPAQYVRSESRYLQSTPSISWGSVFTFTGGLIAVVVIWLVWSQVHTFMNQPAIPALGPTPAPTSIVQSVTVNTPAVVAQPTAAPPANTAPAQKPVRVEIRVVQPNTWARVMVDNDKKFEDVLENGKTYTWEATNQVQIRTSNAAGIEVIYNGANQGVLGEAGQVVTATYTPSNRIITPN